MTNGLYVTAIHSIGVCFMDTERIIPPSYNQREYKVQDISYIKVHPYNRKDVIYFTFSIRFLSFCSSMVLCLSRAVLSVSLFFCSVVLSSFSSGSKNMEKMVSISLNMDYCHSILIALMSSPVTTINSNSL